MTPATNVHFHPGWRFGDSTVIDAIAEAGVYRTQWETGTSNGGLTAHPDGDRWRWESRIFDGRYDLADAALRPVYGAWNRRDDPYGAAPRFGSAYLRLRPDALARTTFCWPDSVFEPTAIAGPDGLEELCALADAGVSDAALVPAGAAGLSMADPLNDYVEAHLHGGLVLAQDVEAVVVDPTDREVHANALARLGCAVEVHPGYRLHGEAVDPSYRGDPPVDLALRLGDDITPAVLAAAQRTGRHDPQAVKWLWHALARFGRRDGSP